MEGADLHEVARERLSWTTDTATADAMMREVLAEIGVTHLRTVEELRRFGEALLGRGDIGKTVGSLLILHCGRVRGA